MVKKRGAGSARTINIGINIGINIRTATAQQRDGTQRLTVHEQTAWMLRSLLES